MASINSVALVNRIDTDSELAFDTGSVYRSVASHKTPDLKGSGSKTATGRSKVAAGRSKAATGRSKVAAGRVKKFKTDHPRIFWLIVTVVILIVLAGFTGTIVYVAFKKEDTSDEAYLGEAKTFYDGICSQDHVSIVASPQCIVGAAPASNSCQSTRYCRVFSYDVARKANGSAIFRDQSFDFPTTKQIGHPTLCRLRSGNSEKLGVCSKDGSCDRIYPGQDDDTWYVNGSWDDNCDEPNLCWKYHPNTFEMLKDVNGPSRDECRNKATKNCGTPGVDATVWMQHLRCKVGNNQTTPNSCTGKKFLIFLNNFFRQLFFRSSSKIMAMRNVLSEAGDLRANEKGRLRLRVSRWSVSCHATERSQLPSSGRTSRIVLFSRIVLPRDAS